MGTTVTMAFHLGQQLWIAHVGDSRAYLYTDGELEQITQDHTVTAELVRRGDLRPDEVPGHRLRHQTSPMPPEPRGRTISYASRREPGARGIPRGGRDYTTLGTRTRLSREIRETCEPSLGRRGAPMIE
jgi:hypothetical protein